MIKPVTYQGVFNFQAHLYALEIKSRFIDQTHADGYYKNYGNELAATVVGQQIKIDTGAFVVQGRMNEIVTPEMVAPSIYDGFVGYVCARVETYHPSDAENCTLVAYVNRTLTAINLRQDDIYAANADNENKVYELPLYSFRIAGNTITDLVKLIGAIDDYAKVKQIADAANSAAQTALTTAQAANATANTANGKSDNAVTIAGNAVTTANTANGKADNAVATANAASQTASAAEQKADNAVATANTANGKSDAAVETANGAATTAGNADSKADTALATANTANGKSDAAVETANGAATTAGNADTKATNAVTTANRAETTANNAAQTVAQHHEQMTSEIADLSTAIGNGQGTTVMDGDQILGVFHVETLVDATDEIVIIGGDV